ncbi:MAG: photosystem II repair protein Psb32 [Synechococcus sp.]
MVTALTRRLIAGLISLVITLAVLVPSAAAIAPSNLPEQPPETHLFDDADVFSRASTAELENRLKEVGDGRIDARLVTVRRLDYGFSLRSFGEELLERWSNTNSSTPMLLLVIETQNKRAAVVADPELTTQLPESLLTSTGRATMANPLRQGDRYRQASIDGLNRLATVLEGGEDPGPPQEIVRTTLPTNVPTKAETEESDAFTWVIVLLVVGTIVPMATWWVFSR